MVDWSALTVPEVVAIASLGGTLLAVYKGVRDAKKPDATPIAPAAVVKAGDKEVTVDIDLRYVEAMEAMAEAFTAVSHANNRVADVNGRQAAAMEGISTALTNWIHKYERDKDEDRLDTLETQITRIYNIIAPPETRPVRHKPPAGEHQ